MSVPDVQGAAGAPDPLELLLEVQDLDIALAQLEHRRMALPERRDLAAADAKLAELAALAGDLQRRRQDLVDRLAEMEAQVNALSERRQSLEARLYGARGSAARDLQAIDAEIQHLTQRRAEIEEEELAIMEEQEPLDAELARLAGEQAELESAAGSLRDALAASEVVLQAEISTVARTRGEAASRLPTALCDRYEVLRGRLGGIGAARLIGNRCDGCHLELPSAEVDRIRHLPAGTVVTCEECGRILVRAPGPAQSAAPERAPSPVAD
ncbi:MAG: C4-type zinc ribbon domain-containing protein [Actinomycetota bacterium]|nr:C4-type zinc ribbon domain-containing protein [Actinomycetota bacterium]